MYRAGIRFFVAAVLTASAVCLYAVCGAGRADAMGAGYRGNAVSAEDVEAVKQIAHTMGDAMVTLDMSTLDRIFADDWAAVSKTGQIMTKQELMESIRSGDHRLVSYELGPMDVQIVGDVAVAHGTVKEQRLRNGQKVDMEGVYMDFLKKRNGRWVVVRSGGGMMEPKS